MILLVPFLKYQVPLSSVTFYRLPVSYYLYAKEMTSETMSCGFFLMRTCVGVDKDAG